MFKKIVSSCDILHVVTFRLWRRDGRTIKDWIQRFAIINRVLDHHDDPLRRYHGVVAFRWSFSTGIYTVKDDRTEQKFTGQLSKEELEGLIDVVNATHYAAEKAPHGCADCFIYDIQIIGDDGKFSAQVDDISIEGSGLSALVLLLRGIIERELI